jgi:hypothetical protein
MPFESDSPGRRTLGPAVASAVVGVVIGGLIAFGAAMMADNTDLPADSVDAGNAVLGSVEYGERR